MVFSSPIFLFLFLPIVLAFYFVLPERARNLWLLAASLVFYGWGEPSFVLIMLGSIAANFGFGLWIARIRGRPSGHVVLALAVVLNLGLLGLFKYANFFVTNVSGLLSPLHLGPVAIAPIALPLGISFYTFHALSYVVDVYRGVGPVQRNAPVIGLYIVFFPQLIAGPIIRYHYIAEQLVRRSVTREGFAHGVERFLIGLAIGLALMFGFRFPENFNYPYISQSMTEFWRRWHISLSTWFRDYLYVPLGGNRGTAGRTYFNLVVVFFLCGLWHGAAWSFVVWGLYHGAFLILERLGFGRTLERAWLPFRHAYVLLAVMVGWVFFRSETLPAAAQFLRAMAGFGAGTGLEYHVGLYLDSVQLLAIGVGAVGSAPLLPSLARWRGRISTPGLAIGVEVARVAGLALLFLGSAMLMGAGTYNPFIYFRF